MSEYRMRVIGMVGWHYNSDPATDLPDPCYLETYDAAYMRGRGRATFTSDPSKAMTWPTAVAVLEQWREVSPTRPIREDGRPNRPLTAYTITPEEIPAP